MWQRKAPIAVNVADCYVLIIAANRFMRLALTGSCREERAPDRGRAGAWAALCQALFAANEFIYVNYVQLWRALLVQQADAVDDTGCTPCVSDHF